MSRLLRDRALESSRSDTQGTAIWFDRPEGNHGEDVKELYYYLDSTPTHSYMKALYKYPQREFPYASLVAENRRRGLTDLEFDLVDTGVFRDDKYFDVYAEYAKAAPDDMRIRITIQNCGPDSAPLDVLPTVWFRNTWSWQKGSTRPRLSLRDNRIELDHRSLNSTVVEDLGLYYFSADTASDGSVPQWLFTENETNSQRLFGWPNPSPFTKDAFHRYVVNQEGGAVNPAKVGTKAAALYRLHIPARSAVTIHLQLRSAANPVHLHSADTQLFQQRINEADEFYSTIVHLDQDHAKVQRQAHAGLLWNKQFYNYEIADWLAGDPAFPPPSANRKLGRNHNWKHLHARDILSMPDKWEYPWFAAWDTAFHMLPFAETDPEFAKDQMLLFLREWYLHPNGQIPAYEWKFSDVNPPVHAWACWRIYKIAAPAGQRDREFLERCFQKLLLNFTWWVNRKDSEGRNLFAGGFLGLDNIGVFDRSTALPLGQRLEQADGTAWMAFYALTMLNIALELAQAPDGTVQKAYEDMASKFFEHFVEIVDAINSLGGQGLWDESDGFLLRPDS